MKLISRILFTLSFTFLFLNVSAQFTYLEADIGYQYIRFVKGDFWGTTENQKVKTNLGTMTLSGICRPNRVLGGGIAIGLPLAQSTRWGFNEVETSGSSYFYDNDNTFSSNPDYAPSVYEYNIQHSPSITFLARIFFKPQAKLYVDLRYTVLNLTETFTFKRGGKYPASINHTGKRTAKGPGFSFIYNYELDNGFYLKYQYSIDFLDVDRSPAMSYNVVYQENYLFEPESVRLRSPIDNKHRMHNWVFGFGYYF